MLADKHGRRLHELVKIKRAVVPRKSYPESFIVEIKRSENDKLSVRRHTHTDRVDARWMLKVLGTLREKGNRRVECTLCKRSFKSSPGGHLWSCVRPSVFPLTTHIVFFMLSVYHDSFTAMGLSDSLPFWGHFASLCWVLLCISALGLYSVSFYALYNFSWAANMKAQLRGISGLSAFCGSHCHPHLQSAGDWQNAGHWKLEM